jgi:hypothetical protein
LLTFGKMNPERRRINFWWFFLDFQSQKCQ